MHGWGKKQDKHLTSKFIHCFHFSKKCTSFFFKTMKCKNSSIRCFAGIIHCKFINPYALNTYTCHLFIHK